MPEFVVVHTQVNDIMDTGRSTYPGEVERGVAELDLLAAVLSVACLIHCLALPLLISVLALSVPFTENEAVHIGLVLMAAPATLWVIHKSRAMRNQRLFIAAASIGLVILLSGTFLPPLAQFEEPLTVVGALILASAHLWHWSELRALRRTVGQVRSQSESTG